ncbi:MAG: hypothetical protein K2O35_01980 [Clostridia bacterium]|nr:hypothetical protein [Clostridia bacterium]
MEQNKNLELYEKVREVPEKAMKEIGGGRLKGMTDINPMWRIKTLTEQFGVCGFGWYPEITRTWTDNGVDGEVVVNVEINLYVKIGDTWSKPIQGIGGSRLVAVESKGLYTDDECYKKAYTDALSVACKALGIGADVYWSKDSTKYPTDDTTSQQQKPKLQSKYSIIQELIKDSKITNADVDKWIVAKFGSTIKINNLTDDQFEQLKTALEKKIGGGNE